MHTILSRHDGFQASTGRAYFVEKIHYSAALPVLAGKPCLESMVRWYATAPPHCEYTFNLTIRSNVPLTISEARQRLIAPCIGLGAFEAIAAYAELSLQRCQKRQKGHIFAVKCCLSSN